MDDLIDACSIPLKDIEPDQKLPADVYLFINGKFIKFKNKSDVIPTDRWDKFIRQKVQYLFIKVTDKQLFQDWISKNKKQKKKTIL